MDILGGIGAALGVASGVTNAYAAYQNVQAQKQANETNIDLAKNAVTYRTEDLKRAGLNPLLAAGSAMTGPTVKAATLDNFDPAAKVMAGVQAAQAMSATNAQKRVLDMQANKLQAETIGQEIQNQFAARLAGNQAEGQELDNAFKQAINPLNIEAMVKSNKGKDLANLGIILDNNLKKIGIDNAAIDLIRNKLGVQADKLGISAQELDIVAKQVAIELAKIKQNSDQFDLDYKNRIGHPVTGNPSLPNRFLDSAVDLGSRFENLFRRK